MPAIRLLLPAMLAMAVNAQAGQPLDVSIIQLIANPEAYQGKTVRIIGFLHLEFEGNGLYLHQEDYIHSLYSNGIWINAIGPFYTKATSDNNRYVLVVGTFDSKDHGHMGLWPGAIKNLERLDSWP